MAITENKWGVIYCPKGGYRNHKRWKKIKDCLHDNAIDFDYVQSENTDSVDRLVKMMINNSYKTIIIVGGDSALNDAVNCLMSVDAQVRDSVALGVIPNGTMNDFAHFWGFDEVDYEQTIKWLKAGRIRKVDLGCIRYVNRDHDNCHRYFLNCVNIGLLSTVTDLRNRTRHIFMGSRTLSFFFSFLLMTFQRLDYKMHLKINMDEIKRRVMTVCIGNSSGYGQTPNAVPYNGLLDVSVVYQPKVTQLFEGFYLLVKNKFLNHKSVHPYRTREVEVVNSNQALVTIDGRLMKTPIGSYKITVEQEIINFLIPE
ncbi:MULTISPECIES: diacylglycerol/lipid kinase family protein [Segatella]|jgi:YegS/Rv2252/BmrU family lipid kinase|uniref:Diacylglycerol kinase n=2 Tax=Segatella TaxID=2974251 RepID=D8DZJ3_9BACT|nr:MULTISPECIES: diacylglycerol kinase family protein [Segatella]EFI71078.1 diacylglycerol kinase [Segatella baroniae B14]MDR4930601.1 diacylglycerol kinase family protein [Segatella bryantii]UKK78223.1 lipid kinase [Segatella baroniae B14]SDZ98110.1 lipid kinase, YegS/Rv2252/BmrU family [Segatella bryantii]SEP68946.1 lipid kinase, YegS/Rv2252/BmrU family [Segatella baroniae B14]